MLIHFRIADMEIVLSSEQLSLLVRTRAGKGRQRALVHIFAAIEICDDVLYEDTYFIAARLSCR